MNLSACTNEAIPIKDFEVWDRTPGAAKPKLLNVVTYPAHFTPTNVKYKLQELACFKGYQNLWVTLA